MKNCNTAGSFAMTYSGKAIPQSKVPNFSNFEIVAKLVSHDAAGRSEEKSSGIQAF